jgi:hypothetical protein
MSGFTRDAQTFQSGSVAAPGDQGLFPEPAGGVPPGHAEAALGPLEGVAVLPPGAAAPSDHAGIIAGANHPGVAAVQARKAEIRQEGQARAEAGTAALTNYLEELRENGESELVTAVMKTAWHETARAVSKDRK